MTTAIRQKTKIQVRLPIPHSRQLEFLESPAKRVIIRAGRRAGKTVGAAIKAVEVFAGGRRVLYAAPTSEQTEKFWFEVKQALRPLVETGVFKQNDSEQYIERIGTEQRIKAKTAWNADTLRGDYADLLILDEYQLTNEDVWEVVGQPMLLDNNGDAIFIYTPPSLRSAGVSKARDPRHAAKLFRTAQADSTGRWQTFHFTSHDNPYISREALSEIIKDMSKQSYRQEILAEDDELQLSWLVYRAFNEATNVIDDFEIPRNWLVYSGHDFGGANPAALFSAQDPATGNFYEFKEYLGGAGHSTFEHTQEFKRIICLPGEYGKERPETYNMIWRSGGNHQEEEIRQGYTAHGWSIMEPKITGPGSVSVQIDRVIGFMERNKIFTFKSLYNLLEERMNCLWLPDNEGRPTDKIKDETKYHLSACARYLYSNFTPETATRRKIGGRLPAWASR